MTRRNGDVLFPAVFLVPAAVAVGQAFAPGAAIYSGPAPTVAGGLTAVAKLVLLGLAAWFSYRNARGLASAQERVASAWRRLAAGWGLYFTGQACLAWYQLRGLNAPFPSVGDAFFLAAYPFFFASLLTFLGAYREAGFAPDTPAVQGRFAAIVSAACLAVAVPLLHPTAVAPTRPSETALNLAYPVLDLALVVPLVLLVRMAHAFRGGAVARMWGSMLAGLSFMCAGDVLFAYFSALGRTGLDPFVHATYLLAYGLVAEGARRQQALLEA
ncbi:MAG TPA: hypothetical protein VFO85_06285 [Vicinamibacteria bacterium]|nr:hypothetical protein [Vicinamibacteria bacterium]